MSEHATEPRPSPLRAWRQEQGLSLAEVAGLTGLTPSMLSRVERGQRRLAPLTRVRVARRLGVRIGDLFDADPLRASCARHVCGWCADHPTTNRDQINARQRAARAAKRST